MDINSIISNMNFDMISGIAVVLILTVVSIVNRDKIQVQQVVGYLIYMISFPTKHGIKAMDKIATKYRELVKLYGYISIGIGFLGMVVVTLLIFIEVIMWIVQPYPDQVSGGVQLVLPFTNIPGIGYLSFWHFFISIFVLAVFHEFAHGVVARAHNLELKSTGFALGGIILPILPAAFVEPDEKKMQKKQDVVQYSVFGAGPMANMVLAVIFGSLFVFALMPIQGNITEPVGVSYQVIDNSSYPSVKADIPESGLINSVNGEQINNTNQMLNKLKLVEPGEDVDLEINDTTYSPITIENPKRDTNHGFIGVKSLQNERRFIDSYDNWKGAAFGWFQGLFKWLFLLNFFVGLINLLPMGPVDGGRMFGLALQKLLNDKKKAQKIWAYVGFLFLFIIVLGLIVNYVGNPFLLFN